MLTHAGMCHPTPTYRLLILPETDEIWVAPCAATSIDSSSWMKTQESLTGTHAIHARARRLTLVGRFPLESSEQRTDEKCIHTC